MKIEGPKALLATTGIPLPEVPLSQIIGDLVSTETLRVRQGLSACAPLVRGTATDGALIGALCAVNDTNVECNYLWFGGKPMFHDCAIQALRLLAQIGTAAVPNVLERMKTAETALNLSAIQILSAIAEKHQLSSVQDTDRATLVHALIRWRAEIARSDFQAMIERSLRGLLVNNPI